MFLSQGRPQTIPHKEETKDNKKGRKGRYGYGKTPVRDCEGEGDVCPDVCAGEGRLDEGEEGEDCRRYNGKEGDDNNPVVVTPYNECTMKL